MWQIFASVYTFIFGLALILFNKKAANFTSNFYYKFVKKRFSVQGYRVVYIFLGIGSTILGILGMLNIIRFQ